MARISETFPLGTLENLTKEDLILYIQQMYTDLAIAINAKPDIIQRKEDGVATETFLANGTININLTSNKVEMITNHTTPTNVTWTTLS